LKQIVILFILLLSVTSESHAEKMRVAYASFGPALSPSWVTAEKGFWKKHGLDVELIYLGGGSRSVPALLSGSIEVFLDRTQPATLRICRAETWSSWAWR
jgi:NitT/TauT family transport system substrate-binding protein